MNQDSADSTDRPLLPPGGDAEPGMLRWVVAALAVLVLIVGAYHAYDWLVSDISHRRAVAEGTLPAPSSSEPAPPRDLVPPPAALPAPSAEPAAPAITGAAGINKCVLDGQVTYTNGPCPDGAEPLAPAVAGTDPNGVAGSAGNITPTVVARPAALAGSSDPSQLVASCAYLAAEIDRLGFEFRQPLPPPVLDHISTQLALLRAQSLAADCAPLAKVEEPKPGAAARRTPRKVVEEKVGD